MSDFVWFDPVNNDPHFVNAMAALLARDGTAFDVIATARRGFQWAGRGTFTPFMPRRLSHALAGRTRRAKVLVSLVYPFCMARALWRITRTPAPLVFSTGPWYPALDGLALHLLRRLGRPPLIVVHRPEVGSRLGLVRRWLLFDRTFTYLALSRYGARCLSQQCGIPPANVCTMPLPAYAPLYEGVLPDAGAASALTAWKGSDTLFVYLSGLSADHGLEDLTAAFTAAAADGLPYKFLVAGNTRSHAQARLAARVAAAARSLPNVRCQFGFYSDQEAVTWLALADAVMLPYRRIAQSAVKSQALSFGVPVLVTDVGGLSEGVVEGGNGCVVPDQSPQAWAKAFAAVRAGMWPRERVRAHFAAEAGQEVASRCLREALAQANSPRPPADRSEKRPARGGAQAG